VVDTPAPVPVKTDQGGPANTPPSQPESDA
jgi:hypothetical protein